MLAGSLLFARSSGRAQAADAQAGTGSATTTLPSFEVASIRAVLPGQGGYTSISPYGEARFTATNVSLSLLISLAYEVDTRYLEGKPDWMDSTSFDVEAKSEGDLRLTYDELRPRLQQLLEQRFHLAVHRETKEFSGYALVVAKSGPKVKAAQNVTAQVYILTDGIRGAGIPIKTLAGMVSSRVHRPVTDQTQLAGMYDITLHYAPEASTDSDLTSIFTALQEQLGLKLTPAKVPVEMLVIEHVDKQPTEN